MRHAQLKAFHHVAIHGGFSKAAKILGRSQPAISDQVKKLEIDYDIRLFDRQKKQVVLTDAGKKLLDITLRYFDAEQLAQEFLSETKFEQTGSLKIIADSARHMLHILGAFRTRNPAIRVSVRISNSMQIMKELQNYKADIGVLGEIPSSSEYDVINLGSTRLVAFAANDFKSSTINQTQFSASMEVLCKNAIVLREPGSKTRTKFEQHAKAMGLKLSSPKLGQFEVEGREAVREIVASGGGIGIVSEAEFTKDQRLRKIQITDADIRMEEALICLRERNNNRLIRTFMKLSRELNSDTANFKPITVPE